MIKAKSMQLRSAVHSSPSQGKPLSASSQLTPVSSPQSSGISTYSSLSGESKVAHSNVSPAGFSDCLGVPLCIPCSRWVVCSIENPVNIPIAKVVNCTSI